MLPADASSCAKRMYPGSVDGGAPLGAGTSLAATSKALRGSQILPSFQILASGDRTDASNLVSSPRT